MLNLSVILKAIIAQKAGYDWQKDNGKYIPYPSTWLNSEGWEDEIVKTEPNAFNPNTGSWQTDANLRAAKAFLEDDENE